MLRRILLYKFYRSYADQQLISINSIKLLNFLRIDVKIFQTIPHDLLRLVYLVLKDL